MRAALRRLVKPAPEKPVSVEPAPVEPPPEKCDTCFERKDVLNTITYMNKAVIEATYTTYTPRRLQAAAERGCRSCDFRHRVVCCITSDQEKAVLFRRRNLVEFNGETFEIFRVPGEARSHGFPGVEIGHLLSEGTSSNRTFTRIRTWLDDCTLHHAACKIAGGSQPFMPKRALNLTQGRVFLQEDVRPSTYACLSHCWGKSHPPTRTLKATIKEYMTKGIPWDALSKTFQDAVDICRRLEIDHLWIDSLCIIQDSDEDWNEEAVRMGDIYAHAFITIAATTSEDGSKGCYRDRDPVYTNCDTVIEGSVYLRRRIPVLSYANHDDLVHDKPLLNRAWALQELLLSPRVIHFMAQEVIWQCSERQRSESGSNDLHNNLVPGRDMMTRDKFINEISWRQLVSEYSNLQMSFEKDRLPALAAISQRAAKRKPADDRFLAGLWMRSLLLDLFWVCAKGGGDHVSRPTEGNAPSWSWVSVQTRVWWPDHTPLPHTHVVATKVETIGSPYLGQYVRAELVIEGPVLSTTLGNIKAEGDLDAVLAIYRFYPDFEFTIDGPFYGGADSQVTLLALVMERYGVYQTCALALRLRDDKRTYERIGLLAMKCKGDGGDADEESSKAFKRQRVESHLYGLPWVVITVA